MQVYEFPYQAPEVIRFQTALVTPSSHRPNYNPSFLIKQSGTMENPWRMYRPRGEKQIAVFALAAGQSTAGKRVQFRLGTISQQGNVGRFRISATTAGPPKSIHRPVVIVPPLR